MKMNNFIQCMIFVLCCLTEYQTFIVVPEELPSILSVFYSNVPPVKKGTDSRVGIGFRLGPNADFQVQFEIGPQTNTQPIGPQAATNNTSKKRQIFTTSASNFSKSKVTFNSTNPSEKWLNTWAMNLNEDENQNLQDSQVSDPTKENPSSSFVNQLRQLYKAVNNTSNVSTR